MREHAAILGPTSAQDYCQTLSLGNFYIILFLQQESSTLGHELLTKIEDSVNQNPEIFPCDLVKNYAPDNCNIVIAKIENQKLHLAMLGKVVTRLFRNGKIIDLSSSTGSLSGNVSSGDLLLLATSNFIDVIPPTSIDPTLSPESLKDQFAPNIENQEGALAAIFIFVKENNDENIIVNNDGNIIEKKEVFIPTNQKRRLLYGVFILLLIIISFIAYQLRSKTLDQKLQATADIEKQTQEELLSANKLVGLNDIMARDILLQSKNNLLAKAEFAYGKNWQTKKDPAISKIKELLQNLNLKISEVSHIYKVDNLVVFSDLALLRPNAGISGASLIKKEIILADSVNGSVYSVMADSKKANIVTGSDNFKTTSFIDKNADAFYLANSSGIFSINKQIAKPSDKWMGISGLKFFAGNIYLLDPRANQIWKYQGTDLGFVDLVPYLQTGISVDLSRVVDFAIDGFVYVLSSTGSIVKFSAGSTVDFTIVGLDTPLANPSSIFATDETNNIYILDNNRVVVLNKEGVYQSQYIFTENFTKAIVLADENVKKIFLVSGSKIYSIDIK